MDNRPPWTATTNRYETSEWMVRFPQLAAWSKCECCRPEEDPKWSPAYSPRWEVSRCSREFGESKAARIHRAEGCRGDNCTERTFCMELAEGSFWVFSWWMSVCVCIRKQAQADGRKHWKTHVDICQSSHQGGKSSYSQQRLEKPHHMYTTSEYSGGPCLSNRVNFCPV